MTMKRVYKYPVELTDEFSIHMPDGARPLTVQMQGERPYVWALVDETQPAVSRRFRLAGTGHPIVNADALVYVGSFQMHGGSLVFHLFVYPE